MATRQLNVLLTGDATAMKRSFAQATTAAGRAKVGIAAAVVGAGLALKELYDVGAEFDEAFDVIRTGTGKTGKQLDGLKDDFKNVVSSVPTDFAPASEAIAELNTRLGISGKPLRERAKQFLELSRITKTDVAENVKFATRAFGDWEVGTGKQGRMLDFFFRASQASGATVQELTDLVVQFGAPLRQVGFNVEEATAMFASFEKAGVNIQTMMPGLKFALKTFYKEGKDPQQALLKTFKGIETGSIDTSEALDIFGQRAGADMVEAVEQGRFKIKDFTKEIASGKDTIKDAGEDTRSAGESFKVLGNKLKVLIEPAASAVFEAVGKVADSLARLNLRKLARELGTSGEELREFGHNVAVIFEAVAPVIKDALHHAAQFLKHFAGVVRGVVKVVASLLKGDFGGAWDGVKQIFRSGVKATLHLLGAITAPIRAIGGKIKGVLSGVFSGAWGKVKEIFHRETNAVIDLLNAMIGVINKVPFIDIGKIGNIGGDGGRSSTGSPRNQALRRQSGGVVPGAGPGDKFLTAAPEGSFILNREATAAAGLHRQRGGMVPVALEAGERMFTPEEVRRIGLGNLQAINAEVPRFAVGGIVGSLVSKGAGAVLGKLPKPGDFLPAWMDGSYFVKAIGEWVKEKFAGQKKSGSLVPGFTGPPPNFKQLGDNDWVDSHTLRVGSFLAKKFGSEITDGWRPQNASYGAKFSSHKRGSPSNPGALDFGPPSTAMQSWAGKHIAGLTENDIHDWGTGLHNHIAFFQQGGVVKGFANAVRSTSAPYRAALALYAAGLVESGLRNLPYGDRDSTGSLQVRAGTAKGLGIDPMNVGQVARAFLTKGFWGKGSAISLAKKGVAPGAIAQMVQGSAFPERYAEQLDAARRVMREAGLRFDGQTLKTGSAAAGAGNAGGAKKAKPKLGLGGSAVVEHPPLEPGKVPGVLKGLDSEITSLFTGPGMSREQRFGASELALGIAEDTAGSADDRAVLQFQLGASEQRKQAVQREIKRLNRRLSKRRPHGKRLTPKQRKQILGKRNALTEELSTVQGQVGSAREGLKDLQPTARDFADLALARAEATPGMGDDIVALEGLKSVAEQELAVAKASGDPREIAEATRNLTQAAQALNDAKPTKQDFANRDLAMAQLTETTKDDLKALNKLKGIAEKELKAARKTADPRDDIEAANTLKQILDQLKQMTPSAEDFANRDLALAQLTETLEDDRAALERLEQIARKQLDAALKTADPRDDIEAANTLKGILDQLKQSSEKPEIAEEMKALREEMELNRRIAEEEASTSAAVARRAIADIVAGQLGPRAARRANTAGAGTVGNL